MEEGGLCRSEMAMTLTGGTRETGRAILRPLECVELAV
jgi:hypothetical protein